MHAIYLDNNASSPMLPQVWEAMKPFLCDHPGNPASSHRFGRHARHALETARERIAALLDAQPEEVVFTSGATEANNLALFGLTLSSGTILTSALEHPCVLEPIQHLVQRHGFTRAHLPIHPHGIVDLDALALPDDLRLAALMLANHETGAVQPVRMLAERLAGSAHVHCDAAAAAGKMPISFRQLGATTLTISAHKFHGPKGIGALLLQRRVKLRPQLFGGHQQQGKRPGTEPVALAVGMATALEWSVRNLDANRAKLVQLRRRFLDALRATAAPVLLNGPEDDGLPHALNLSFPGCQADALMMSLDLAGVACSTGSACSSGSLLPSPVLAAMGIPRDALHSALRFSLSALLTDADIDEAAGRVQRCVTKLRQTDLEAE
jgi:cysteine desulfurase